jgi:hypothetical protein
VSKGWSVEYRFPSIEEDPSFIDDVLEYANSPEGVLYSEVGDTVSVMLERADVDAKERQIIWEDGERLSITASAQRIVAEHPDIRSTSSRSMSSSGSSRSSLRQPTRRSSSTSSIDSPRRGLRIISGKQKRPRKGQELATLEIGTKRHRIHQPEPWTPPAPEIRVWSPREGRSSMRRSWKCHSAIRARRTATIKEGRIPEA